MPAVKRAAMSAVAATTAGNGMPAFERMIALTTRMYDMTRKFVMPPRTSVPIVEPAARTWNCRSIQSVLPPTAAVRAAMSPSSATLTPTRESPGALWWKRASSPGRGEHTRVTVARLGGLGSGGGECQDRAFDRLHEPDHV